MVSLSDCSNQRGIGLIFKAKQDDICTDDNWDQIYNILSFFYPIKLMHFMPKTNAIKPIMTESSKYENASI